MEGNQPISLGLLGSSPNQAAFVMAGSTRPSHLSITAEPAGGSVFPTGQIIVTGTV
jgi:anti-sigma-K factor RskA